MSRFALAGQYTRGYKQEQVDRFFEHAKATYEGRMSQDAPGLQAGQVRGVAFDLIPGGYDIHQVDVALDRLEDELARLERDQLRVDSDDESVIKELQRQADQLLQERLGRPAKDRFDAGAGVENSYSRKDVDELCDRVAAFLQGDGQLAANEVRHAIFRGRKGRFGYSESQVDAFFDRVTNLVVKSAGG